MALLSDESLTELLPRAVAWAFKQERDILQHGSILNEVRRQMARKAGVKEAERIRLRLVPEIRLPEEEDLRLAARALGLNGCAEALTLGYGILLREEHGNDENVIAHELVHVAQCERLGGLLNFLTAYLKQCNQYGYCEAPMELEALQFSRSVF
jgi:hypothetical protein